MTLVGGKCAVLAWTQLGNSGRAVDAGLAAATAPAAKAGEAANNDGGRKPAAAAEAAAPARTTPPRAADGADGAAADASASGNMEGTIWVRGTLTANSARQDCANALHTTLGVCQSYR